MNSTTVNDVLRFDRSATGYLDLFGLMNQDQASVFQPILTSVGEKAQLMFANLLETAKFSTASEITVRQNERLIMLGRGNVTNAFDSSASVLNDQAIRHANRALKFVNDLREDLGSAPTGAVTRYRMLPEKESVETVPVQREVRGIFELRDVTKLPEFSDSLADAKEAFLTTALQLNFTNNREFVEILEIWDKTMALAHKEGTAGVLGAMAESLEQFVSRRNTEERGTSPASPLAWWKYIIIALYVGASVFAVIACFWWSACTWVWPAISATAPWIFKIVEMGC
jgi:hypothetical protein